jgi:hypothetical protein
MDKLCQWSGISEKETREIFRNSAFRPIVANGGSDLNPGHSSIFAQSICGVLVDLLLEAQLARSPPVPKEFARFSRSTGHFWSAK